MRRRELALTLAGLNDPGYADMTFESFVIKDEHLRIAVKACTDLISRWEQGDWANGLLMYSQYPGRGKTHLAVALAREAIKLPAGECDRIVQYWTVSNYLRQLKDSYSANPVFPTRTVLDSVLTPLVLILDDLGLEARGSAEWYEEEMYRIANHRWINRLGTIITTNITGDHLQSRLGRRAYSRFISRITYVPFHGDKDERLNQ